MASLLLDRTQIRDSGVVGDVAEPAHAFHERLRHAMLHRPFHSLPTSLDRETIETYFAPLLEALSRTPKATPLPAGPQGEVYHLHPLEEAERRK